MLAFQLCWCGTVEACQLINPIPSVRSRDNQPTGPRTAYLQPKTQYSILSFSSFRLVAAKLEARSCTNLPFMKNGDLTQLGHKFFLLQIFLICAPIVPRCCNSGPIWNLRPTLIHLGRTPICSRRLCCKSGQKQQSPLCWRWVCRVERRLQGGNYGSPWASLCRRGGDSKLQHQPAFVLG